MRQLLSASDAWITDLVEREAPMEDSLRYFEGVQGFPRKSVIPFNDRSSTASFVPIRSQKAEKTDLQPKAEVPAAANDVPIESVKTIPAEKSAEVVHKVQEVKKLHAYYIIVGSYKEGANKDKRIAELQTMGYQAEVAPEEVSTASLLLGFPLAQKHKSPWGIKQRLHKGAWIYRRP